MLNWTAGTAKQVIDQLRVGWDRVRQRYPTRIVFHPETLVGSTSASHVTCLLADLVANHAAVVVAAGFGIEPEHYGTKPYWIDEPARYDERGTAWLISGFGDGALADLMRICITGFEHRWLKELVAPVPLGGPLAKDLLAREANGYKDSAALDAFYEREVPFVAVLDQLRPRVNTSIRVVLQGLPDSNLYGTTSAIINRFVTAHIQRLYRDTHGAKVDEYFRVVNEDWRGMPTSAGGSAYRIEFERASPFEGALVVRRGPKPVLKDHFPDIWESTAASRTHLRILPQQLDPSRLPMLSAGPLWKVQQRSLGEGKWWCLVVTSSPQLKKIMSWALPKLEDRLKTWYPQVFDSGSDAADALAAATEPTFVSVSAALRDNLSYRVTVRALCRADVVVADVTDFDPGTMVLLGIRAAARRGVTIVTSARPPLLAEYNTKIPFNLREISLLDHSGAPSDEKAERFADLIARGLTNYRANTGYQDLPGYAQVRLPRVDWSDTDVLVLCPFSETFEESFQALKGELMRLTKQKATCRRVIDDASPWLNSQRLFGAIRHADACLIDWTEWRHNVFFELGMRLAVHRKGAVCMLDENASEPPQAHRESAALLKSLFRPASYADLQDAWQRYHQTDGDQSYRGETYRTVSEAVEPEQAFFTPVHLTLLASVKQTIGSDPGTVDTKELYATTNDGVLQRYRTAARERLLAAWFYLEHRFNPSAFTDDDLRRAESAQIAAEYLELARDLMDYLKAQEFAELRRDVRTKQQMLRHRLEGNPT